MIVSLMHLNIGISRGIINNRDNSNNDVKNKLRTNNLSQEILYHLAPTHSITHALDMVGIKNVNDAFFVVFINASEELIESVKGDLKEY